MASCWSRRHNIFKKLRTVFQDNGLNSPHRLLKYGTIGVATVPCLYFGYCWAVTPNRDIKTGSPIGDTDSHSVRGRSGFPSNFHFDFELVQLPLPRLSKTVSDCDNVLCRVSPLISNCARSIHSQKIGSVYHVLDSYKTSSSSSWRVGLKLKVKAAEKTDLPLEAELTVNGAKSQTNSDEDDHGDGGKHESESGDVFFMREQRFLHFASVLYDGEVYMTPQDFLHSVTQEGARARRYRVAVDDTRVRNWLKKTPARRSGSTKMFRGLNEQGLISYVEYLFLLCILTEPKSGFEIAFNMFDIDGNQKVDIDEFKVLTKLFSKRGNARKPVSTREIVRPRDLPKATSGAVTTEEISGRNLRFFRRPNFPLATSPPADSLVHGLELQEEDSEKIKQIQQTTLLVHLFGKNGTDVLKYEDFAKFTENLQEEVLDMEFQQYARGLATISEEDFARILLRYTNLSDASIDEYLDRVSQRIIEAKGINFKDFKNFFLFLNHMDDFILMMRLYNLTDQPISKGEFRRAVAICGGGEDISPSVIDAVYTIFDVDGDGSLSTEEFISIMKSRLKRGLRSHLVKEEHGWTKFKNCVRHEMRVKRGGM